MSKTSIMLILTAALSSAQTQPDPADATKKTAREKGYHETSPKNTGATPAKAKDKKSTDSATDSNTKEGLRTQTPPTRQPEIAAPPKS